MGCGYGAESGGPRPCIAHAARRYGGRPAWPRPGHRGAPATAAGASATGAPAPAGGAPRQATTARQESVWADVGPTGARLCATRALIVIIRPPRRRALAPAARPEAPAAPPCATRARRRAIARRQSKRPSWPAQRQPPRWAGNTPAHSNQQGREQETRVNGRRDTPGTAHWRGRRACLAGVGPKQRQQDDREPPHQSIGSLTAHELEVGRSFVPRHTTHKARRWSQWRRPADGLRSGGPTRSGSRASSRHGRAPCMALALRPRGV